MMVVPALNSFHRSFSDSGSSTMRWMVRRSGRAPSEGSYPLSASTFFASSVSSISTSFVFSCSRTRRISRSTMLFTSSRVSEWNTMTSSMRFRNSGRNERFSSSITLSRIFS